MNSLVGSVTLRPYGASDRSDVHRLLGFLPVLYPTGSEWLDKRLEEVLKLKARCTLAVVADQIAGVTIETPKGMHKLKLSTIFVDQKFRAQGIGKLLLSSCRAQWERESLRLELVS